jgi:aspartate/methionine/tyrosine aminotransferase
LSLDELTLIGDLAKKHDLLIISDEALQWFYIDNIEHIRIGEFFLIIQTTIRNILFAW